MTDRYPAEDLNTIRNEWGDPINDNGTMPDNVQELANLVVGRRIVKAEEGTRETGEKWYPERTGLVLTLDDGTEVMLVDTSDCCAYTEVEAFVAHPEMVDHVIMGVGTTEGFTKWHIYADWGDVLNLTVGWSPGNPFYYGYGFDICVIPVTGSAT